MESMARGIGARAKWSRTIDHHETAPEATAVSRHGTGTIA
jgi:hypothetical protein